MRGPAAPGPALSSRPVRLQVPPGLPHVRVSGAFYMLVIDVDHYDKPGLLTVNGGALPRNDKPRSTPTAFVFLLPAVGAGEGPPHASADRGGKLVVDSGEHSGTIDVVAGGVAIAGRWRCG